jgi:hypothetical protein
VGAIPFVREKGEIFQSGALTIRRDAGDCDDHFRLAYALGVAGGLRSALAVMHHGTKVERSKQGPAHAVAVFWLGGRWVFAETTVAACLGEDPNDAARRLGLTTERSDIAKEIRIMSEQDLPEPPDGYAERQTAAQVTLDAEALQRLGYLAPDAPACQMSDPTYGVLRRAVMAFQIANGLAPDGLLGPHTRRVLAVALALAGPPATDGFEYPGMGEIGSLVVRASSHLSDDFLRAVIDMNDAFRARGARTAAEDWLQVWTFESGINAHQQTNAINPKTGLRYENAGINQMGETERRACGFRGGLGPWLALSNEDQLPFVRCFYEGAVRDFAGGDFGAYNGSGAAYVATFAPAHLKHSGNPNFSLYSKAAQPEAYQANRGLDHGGKGYISVDDMRLALLSVEKTALFTEARARIRALGAAPAEPFAPSVGGGLVASLVFLGAGGFAAYATAKGWL